MKIKIKNFVKNNRYVYICYYYGFSFILRFISLFIRKNDNYLFFVSYGGKKYDDSPKVIYEYLKNDSGYSNLKFKWGFINPDEYDYIPNNEKVKIDTIRYYYYLIRSKYWISNSSVQRGLNFKSKKNKNILFMHGLTALKKSSKDFKSKGKQFKMVNPEYFDMVFIEGTEEKEIILRNINVDEDHIYNYGLPRCDELIKIYNNNETKLNIKKKLNISVNKKIILYAPTYREYNKSSFNGIITKPKLDISKWQKELSSEYVLLITSHYEIGNKFDFQYSDFVIDVCNYNSINELLAVTDILITDYSNIVFDYSLLEKPSFCYGYDYKEYLEKGRGFYNSLSDVYYDGVIEDESKLINKIKNINIDKMSNFNKKLHKRFIANYGNSIYNCVRKILD